MWKESRPLASKPCRKLATVREFQRNESALGATMHNPCWDPVGRLVPETSGLGVSAGRWGATDPLMPWPTKMMR